MSREEQMQEALRRIKELDMHPHVSEDFKRGVLHSSQYNIGMLIWLTDEEQEMVDKFEHDYNAVVYHVIKDETDIGTLYSLMFVGEDKSEWSYELNEEYAFVYVVNSTIEWCSEFGSIGIQPYAGGLRRTY